MYKFRRAAVVASMVGPMMVAATSCSAGSSGESTVEAKASATMSAIETTEADGVSVAVAEAAPGLTIEIAANAYTAPPDTYSDGRRGVTYHVDNEAASYTVIVEYYESGGKTASEVLESELGAFELQGASAGVTQSDVSVEGSEEAYRLDWTQSAEVPWSAEDDTEIDVQCSGVIFDGQDGYSYAVYVYAEVFDEASLAAVADVIDSIQVSQP
ncbi:hypothetical protein BW737_007355 [Actinomyces ruminis]|uniref:Lipoprotein LpqN n=2 Tax=Actinomyces ruminis TaxID=1937003 RepID=A0ABX4MB42_9ACTO|nr:hypothetical protein BW737_007355 [Actinomyces ruminis]